MNELDGEITRNEATNSIQHVVLTRFNVRYVEDNGKESIAVNPDWLSHRFNIFETYCWPSLLAQASQSFIWLIFFDENTPKEFKTRAADLFSQRENTHAIYCERLTIDRVRSEVRNVVPGNPDWLLTTRIDNDDGLNRDFLSIVRNAMTYTRPEVINVPVGVIFRSGRTYIKRHRSNAFISLAEPYSVGETVFSINRHTEAAKIFPVIQTESRPLWLQVIHDKNISNRVRGRRVFLNSVAPGFLPLEQLNKQHRENTVEILIENTTIGLFRFIFDIITILLKKAASIFGVEIRRKVRA